MRGQNPGPVAAMSCNAPRSGLSFAFRGRADVGFLDSQVAAYVVHISNGEFKLTGTPFSTAPYGFALPKNSGLAQPFLAAVKTIMANGTYAHVLDKWGVQAGATS